MTVVVKEIPHDAVINSGSMRLVGISDEDFIRTWNWEEESQESSRAEKVREELAQIMNTGTENVDIFSVSARNSKILTHSSRSNGSGNKVRR